MELTNKIKILLIKLKLVNILVINNLKSYDLSTNIKLYCTK